RSYQATTTAPQQPQPASTEPQQPQPASTEPQQPQPASTEPQQPQPASTKPPWPQPQQPQPTSTLPPQPQPPQPQPPRSPAVPSAGVAKAHRGMAIVSAIVTVPTVILAPIGILALIYSSQVKTNLALGSAMGARKASARVVAAFWIAIAIWVIIIIIIIINAAKGANNDSGTSSASIISYSVLP